MKGKPHEKMCIVEHRRSCIDCRRTIVSYNPRFYYLRCAVCAVYKLGRRPVPNYVQGED